MNELYGEWGGCVYSINLYSLAWFFGGRFVFWLSVLDCGKDSYVYIDVIGVPYKCMRWLVIFLVIVSTDISRIKDGYALSQS
jgi:hypothetical protein